jgi:Flp pilus assembly protein TadD
VSAKPHPAAAHNKPAAHQPAQAEEKQAVVTPAPAPSANCTLGANPERFVGLAEQARGRGDYANAIRIFREVLDCDPNNAAAREGLDKATRGAQSQH